MRTSLALLLATAAGAGLAVFLDPATGRRRRARASEIFDHSAHVAARAVRVGARDLEHRLRGLAASLRGGPATHEATDDVIIARIRSRLGHVCSHPHAIHVDCHEGVVELEGPVLREEVEAVLHVARATLGVMDVVDRLERHATAGTVPGLQGTANVHRPKPGRWSPAARLVVGGSGAALAFAGLVRGGVSGIGAALVGAGAVVRSVANVPLEAMRVGALRPAIDVQKTITIRAPIEHVFEVFTRPERLARFMRHVESVERIGDNRWHFRVRGPAGVSFEWDGYFDRLVPNELVVWRSPMDASIRHVGSARFERGGAGMTRLTIRLRYWPPGGRAGHEVARLLGDDPKRELDEDMMRLKSLLEFGKTTGPRGTVTLDEIRSS